jgi:hypothetical protein
MSLTVAVRITVTLKFVNNCRSVWPSLREHYVLKARLQYTGTFIEVLAEMHSVSLLTLIINIFVHVV